MRASPGCLPWALLGIVSGILGGVAQPGLAQRSLTPITVVFEGQLLLSPELRELLTEQGVTAAMESTIIEVESVPDAIIVGRTQADRDGRFRVSAEILPGPYAVRARGDSVRLFGAAVRDVPADRAGATVAVGIQLKQPPSPRSGAQPHAVIRVFFASDREPVPGPPFTYGSRRNAVGLLQFGHFDVSIPRDHRMGHVERPSMWRFEVRESRDRHFVIVDRVASRPEIFYRQLSDAVRRAERRDAFVFVHGFNVAFDEAVYRTAQIAYDLGFSGVPILYSWPSNGELLEYPGDVSNNEWTIPHLKEFLRDVAARSAAQTIHLIAHSMGNRALLNALDRLAAEQQPASPRFRQLVLTAPDIDADIFRQLARSIRSTSDRVTLYASSNDTALKLSKRINGYPRAGDAGPGIVVVPGVDTIDVSALDTSLLGHGYYAENKSVLSDLFALIRAGAPPPGRFGLRPMTSGSGAYWRFAP